MELKEFSRILKDAVNSGATKALAENYVTPQFLIKAEAYRLYGRSNIDRWIKEGLIDLVTSGDGLNKKIMIKKKLDAIAASSNRITYLPVADRKR
ncbi:MAG: hypothetical protein EON51_02205 [Acinetobacter sp.]|nr:MAG: hypothetical protein EON51_02205 [Acinetobacter sp.]